MLNVMGVIYYTKYSKNTDYYKLIEGTLGLEICLKFLWRIIKYVLTFIELSNNFNDRAAESKKYSKILNECCSNKVNFKLYK